MKRKYAKKRDKTRLCLISAVLAAAGGLFGITLLHAAGYERYPGDVNVDHVIDVSDGVLLARYCVEDYTVIITDEGLANADADGDRTIGPADTVCILQMISGRIPKPENPYAVQNPVTGTSAPVPAGTAATPSETAALPAETETPETAAPPRETTVQTTAVPERPAEILAVDGQAYPLGVPLSALNSDAQPDETLTVLYQSGEVVFSVYAAKPEKTFIAFSQNDTVFGYYILCTAFEAPDGYTVTELRDQHQNDRLYGVLVQKKGLSISFPYVENKNDLRALSKLAYYATNGVRAINGLNPYIWDEKLAEVSLAHSREMAEKDFFGHNSYDGTEFSDRLLKGGIDWQACAENVDCGYRDPFTAVNGWYNSKTGHRKNLLNTKYQRVGIGFAYGADTVYQFYGTQDFYRGWD